MRRESSEIEVRPAAEQANQGAEQRDVLIQFLFSCRSLRKRLRTPRKTSLMAGCRVFARYTFSAAFETPGACGSQPVRVCAAGCVWSASWPEGDRVRRRFEHAREGEVRRAAAH